MYGYYVIFLESWDLRGFGSSIRNLLHYKEVEFVDKLYQIGQAPDFQHPEWLADKQTLDVDFPNLPYYIDGDIKLTQSITILRYLARKYDLIGDNETQTLRVELAEQQATDLRMSLIRIVYFNPNYEKDREEYLKGLPGLLKQFGKFLGTNKWIAGDKLTYADFILYDVCDYNRLFDPKSFEGVDIINQYLTRFEEIPQIKAYMSSGNYKKLLCFGPVASWGGQKE